MAYDRNGNRIESEALKRSRARVAALDPSAGTVMADPRTNVGAIAAPQPTPNLTNQGAWDAMFPKYAASGNEKTGSPWSGPAVSGQPSTEADAFLPSEHAERWGSISPADAPPGSNPDRSMSPTTRLMRPALPSNYDAALHDANGIPTATPAQYQRNNKLMYMLVPSEADGKWHSAPPVGVLGAGFKNMFGTGRSSFVPPKDKVNAAYRWGQNSRAA